MILERHARWLASHPGVSAAMLEGWQPVGFDVVDLGGGRLVCLYAGDLPVIRAVLDEARARGVVPVVEEASKNIEDPEARESSLGQRDYMERLKGAKWEALGGHNAMMRAKSYASTAGLPWPVPKG